MIICDLSTIKFTVVLKRSDLHLSVNQSFGRLRSPRNTEYRTTMHA